MQVSKDRFEGLSKVVVGVRARTSFLRSFFHLCGLLSLLTVLSLFGTAVARADTITNAAGVIEAQLCPLLDGLTEASVSLAQSDRTTGSTQLGLTLSQVDSLAATVQSPGMTAALGNRNKALQKSLSRFQNQVSRAKSVVDNLAITSGAAFKAALRAVALGHELKAVLTTLPSADTIVMVSEVRSGMMVLHYAGDTVCFHVNIPKTAGDPSCGPVTVSVDHVGGSPTDVLTIGAPNFSSATDFCLTMGPDAGTVQVTVSTCNQTNSVLLYDYGVPRKEGAGLAAPENLNVPTNTFNTIELAWSYDATGAAGFKVERSPTVSGPWSPIGVTNSTTTYADTGLAGSTVYYYRLRAYNKKGYSPYSNKASKKTSAKTDNTPPSVPGGLNALAATPNQISISWSASTDSGGSGMSGYDLYTNGVQFATTTATSYSWTNLAANAQYCVTVAAYDKASNVSSQSSQACVTTPAAPPLAPTALVAAGASDAQISLSWADDFNNELGFVVETAPAASGPWTVIASVGSNVTTYTQSGLSALSTYYFRVHASNGIGDSPYSNVAAGTTLAGPDTIAPSVPSGLMATAISSNQVNLNWVGATDSGGSGLAGYYIRVNDAQYATVTTPTYTLTGISPNTQYCFTVAAFDNAGNVSAPGSQACATTLGTVPVAPSGVAAVAVSSSQINLTWQDNSSDESGFMVQRASSASGPWTQIGIVGANVTSCAHTGLTASTTYFYRVCAYNAAGNSVYSSVTSATTPTAPDTTAPSVPNGVIASATSTSQVSVSWNISTDSGGSGLAGYNVYRDGTLVTTTTTTGYTDSGLSAASLYCYTVVAYDNAGNNSSPSSQACATTTSGASTDPTPPSNLATMAVTSTSITLNWQDNSDNEVGFQIQRATSAGGPWNVVGSTGANATSYADTGLDPSTTYYYEVVAFN
jgi:fibronectin type 3 domain-containing protein